MFFRGMILVLNRFYDMFLALLFVAFLFAGRCFVGTTRDALSQRLLTKIIWLKPSDNRNIDTNN